MSLVAQGQPLRIVSEAWPPYIYEENGELHGLDYEATRIVLQRLGVQAEWQLLPWKRCSLAVKQGKADAILGTYRTRESESLMIFPSEPLSRIDLVLFYAKARPHPFQAIDDLRGLRIGVSDRYRYSDRAFAESQLFIREQAPNHAANFGKLMRERVNLVVNDRYTGGFVLERMGLSAAVTYYPQVLGRDSLYLGLRRNADLESLAEAFARELRRLKLEPTYSLLRSRYGVHPSLQLATYAEPAPDNPGERR
nr:transporter substrate-binding domain-containing protein [uncultured Pseudomonas sp.]